MCQDRSPFCLDDIAVPFFLLCCHLLPVRFPDSKDKLPSNSIMPAQSLSIQSYFQPDSSHTKPQAPSSPPTIIGDGFTAAEIEATLHPSSLPKWQPRGTYDDADIGSLAPGPRCLTLIGRVVNIYDQHTPSNKPQAAKGCLKLKVKDDTGVIEVSTIL